MRLAHCHRETHNSHARDNGASTSQSRTKSNGRSASVIRVNEWLHGGSDTPLAALVGSFAQLALRGAVGGEEAVARAARVVLAGVHAQTLRWRVRIGAVGAEIRTPTHRRRRETGDPS